MTSLTTPNPADRDLPVQQVRVAIVGGGPSGLTAASELAPFVGNDVHIIEREVETGGIPRQSDHLGYGVRDLRRFMSGPAYARRLTTMARDAGATLETEAQVTGWAGERRLVVTSPRGRRIVEAEAVILATGARERPRPARRIPGDRPDGVYTTGELQNLVHLHHVRVGTRAVVIGAELVSWSAVMTLREAGCKTVAMTTIYPRSESYAAFRAFGRAALRVPVVPRTRVVLIKGKHRVESVIVENLTTGERKTIECDTVITTGDWIPDHELVRTGGMDLDPKTLGPAVDNSLRTSGQGVFAVGNLVHPVDTADAAALDGRHVVAPVRHFLKFGPVKLATLHILAGRPFQWISPQRFVVGEETPRGDLVMWPTEYRRLPMVRAIQDGKVIGEHRVAWPASPGRVFRAPSEVLNAATPSGGPLTIELAGA